MIDIWLKLVLMDGKGYNMINARSETVDALPSFKRLLKKNRCVVLADGFYEWYKYERGGQQHKQPYFAHPAAPSSPIPPSSPPSSFTNVPPPSSAAHLPVYPKDEYAIACGSTSATATPAKKTKTTVPEPSFEAPPLLYMAGLWDSWTDPETKKRLYTFCVLTTEATKEFGWYCYNHSLDPFLQRWPYHCWSYIVLDRIHDRMPVVLSSRERVDKWLDCAGTPFSECVTMLSPHRDNGLHWYAVPQTMSSIKNKTFECNMPLYQHLVIFVHSQLYGYY
jgi:putative SOS response-associated peptidase YedK